MYNFYLNQRVSLLNRSRIRKLLLVMKLTTFILIAAIIQVSASALAQKVTLNEKNARLVDVFNDINAQTGYDFAFTTTTLKDANLVTINVKNDELSDVLTKIFEGQPLNFSIENKSVVVQAKTETLFDKAKAYFAQVNIQGKVTNELGDPMPGVNVKEKGTQNGTVTDNKGAYSLMVADDKSVISFTYIGYEPQELAAKFIPDGSVIKLIPQPQNLQEVVISKGYYDEKRELSTGDIGVVDSKTIEEQPVSDPIQALIGRVAGLNIQQTSGIPGSYASINIRGINSIENGNDPFYVVDGVPFTSVSLSSTHISAGALGYTSNSSGANDGQGLSPFNILNPDDIESIEVLKDADATSIYGSRGANGVILITTKKGKAGETKVNFDISQGIGQVGHFMDLLNTQQYLKMQHEAYANDGLPFPSIASNPNDGNYDIDGVWDTTRYTNWQKTLIGGTAQYTNAQASVSGGTTNTQFLVGTGYTRQTTVYPGESGDGDEKGSVHFSLTNASSNQKFHLQLTGGYGYEDNTVPGIDLTSSVTLAPDAPALYSSNGTLNWQNFQGGATFSNPLILTYENYNSITNSLTYNLDLSYELLPGLLIKSDFGYNHSEMNQVNLIPSTIEPPPYNTYGIYNSNYNATTFSNGWIIEPKISYHRKISKGDLNLLLGGTFQQQTYNSSAYYAYDFPSPALISDPQAAEYQQLEGFNSTLDRYEAILARVNYNWDGKYLLNLTGNRDGSSRFGPGRQFGNFGAIGTGWIFSKEKAVEDAAPWLSFGKLRLSYGTTGNYQIGYYQYLTTYGVQSNTYQGSSLLIPNNVNNNNYSWEVDKKLEGGLELGFLKDRINLSVSYYRNRSGDELIDYPLPAITGVSAVVENLAAVVQNTGVEINLNTVNIKGKDFSWNTSVNFTDPKNKLLAFPGLAESPFANSLVVGQSLYIKELYQYTGVNPQTGFYSFKTSNPSGNPSFPQDAVVTPPVGQKYYGGVTNAFTYKNFSLDIFIQFVDALGYSYQDYFRSPGSDNYNEPTAILGAWNTPGDVASVQRYGTRLSNTGNVYGTFQSSTGILTNTSFVKIRNAALSYRIPPDWQRWAHMQYAKVFLRGENLYTFTHYIGFDPETSGLGLPPLRVITAGVTATF